MSQAKKEKKAKKNKKALLEHALPGHLRSALAQFGRKKKESAAEAATVITVHRPDLWCRLPVACASPPLAQVAARTAEMTLAVAVAVPARAREWLILQITLMLFHRA